MTTTRTTQAQALAAIAACPRVALQYVYSPGDRHGTRYVITARDADDHGSVDRTIYGARGMVDICAALNAGQDI